MIGQSKVTSFFNKSLEDLPHSVLLVGEEGCGKHFSVNSKAHQCNVPVFNLTENLSEEYINQIYIDSVLAFYIIEIDQLTEKEQNIALKLLEEPPVHAYIFITAESFFNILPTILNRCYIVEFETYSKDTLKTFRSDITNTQELDVVLSFCSTPGQIQQASVKSILELRDLGMKVVSRIQDSSLTNTLTLMNKLDFENKGNKFKISHFLKSLEINAFNLYKTEKNKKYFSFYMFMIEERKKLLDKRINLQYFMYNYLVQLWELSRNDLSRA